VSIGCVTLSAIRPARDPAKSCVVVFFRVTPSAIIDSRLSSLVSRLSSLVSRLSIGLFLVCWVLRKRWALQLFLEMFCFCFFLREVVA